MPMYKQRIRLKPKWLQETIYQKRRRIPDDYETDAYFRVWKGEDGMAGSDFYFFMHNRDLFCVRAFQFEALSHPEPAIGLGRELKDQFLDWTRKRIRRRVNAIDKYDLSGWEPANKEELSQYNKWHSVERKKQAMRRWREAGERQQEKMRKGLLRPKWQEQREKEQKD